jgi:hypothetical protein
MRGCAWPTTLEGVVVISAAEEFQYREYLKA